MSENSVGTWEAELDRRLAPLQSDRTGQADRSDPPASAPVLETPSTTSTAQHGRWTDGDADREISVSQLHKEVFHSVRSGMALKEDIYDESGVLLLAAGSIITSRFLQLIRDRGVSRVQLRSPAPIVGPDRDRSRQLDPTAEPTPVEGLHTEHSRDLDRRMAELLNPPLDLRSVPKWRRPRMATEDLKAEAERGVQKHQETSQAVSYLCDTIAHGGRISSQDAHVAVGRFVDKAAVDFDLLPLIVSLQDSTDEYLFDHCVSVAMMSAAISWQLGLDRGTVMEIALGGLLHDIGMLRVPRKIRMADRPLTEDEWREIHLHPLHTLDMMSGIKGLPVGVKFIAYQAHERINGEGYPRGRRGQQVHRSAQIVSIADTYVAMTNERPYRPALSPYGAAKDILYCGRSGCFDRALARAFLDTISLFPIGSRVGLSDGRSARVLRANPGRHTHPLVEEMTDDGHPTGCIIDLVAATDLYVVRAF